MTPRPVALLTGSGQRRIGFHVAVALAERGYALALHYHRSADSAQELARELAQTGTEAAAFAADLRDEAEVRELTDGVLSRFGHIDVLVTSAAIWKRKALEEVRAADVREHFEVNTLGTFLCVQQVGLAMVRQPEGGCIVTMGDWATVRPYRDYGAYFPSKGAIPTLTRMFAVELGTRNPKVRVNCIQPGPVMLPADLPAAEREAAIAGTLVQRAGLPTHVAQAVVHFIENDYLTGVCLPLDGGRSVFAGSDEA